MHSWDTVMSATNLDHNNWYGISIKSEPIDTPSSAGEPTETPLLGGKQLSPTTSPLTANPSGLMDGLLNYSNHHLLHSHHNDSNPTSPQSIDSMDSVMNSQKYFESAMNSYNRPLGFNPLTPPGYVGVMIPPPSTNSLHHQHLLHMQQQHQRQQTPPSRNFMKNDSNYNVTTSTTLTPTHTPPMDVTPPKSPKDMMNSNEITPEKDDVLSNDNRSDDCGDIDDSCDDALLSDLDDDTPRSKRSKQSGKAKLFKCKQCDFVGVTKLIFWEHTRSHIKPEKMLTCPKCPFVTEYKHHLEYHLRNHSRSKPFQCPKCNYSCVNKSMLNSHLKSHSNVFQYRCADCNYATKYCHSLKLHLRKYSHKPDVVLNQDGTPNPLPIIDVYGTRRGPKTKSQQIKLEEKQNRMQHKIKQQQQQQQPPQHPSQHSGMGNNQKTTSTLSIASSTNSNSINTSPSSTLKNLQNSNVLPQNILPNALANMFQNAGTNMPLFPYLNLNFQMFAAQQQAAVIAQLSPNIQSQLQFQRDSHAGGGGLHHHHGGGLMNNNDDYIHETDDDNSKQMNPDSSALNLSATMKSRNSDDDDEDDDVNNNHNNNNNLDDNEYDDCDDNIHEENDCNSTFPRTPTTNVNHSSKNRRKGRAYKMVNFDEKSNESKSSENERMSPMSSNNYPPSPISSKHLQQHRRETQHQQQITTTTSTSSTTSSSSSSVTLSSTGLAQKVFECKFCDISFKDDVLYTIHMGYHGYNDVFKCNMCGEKCDDRVAFFLHIARNSHS